MIRALLAVCFAALTVVSAGAGPTVRHLSFADLAGWAQDDQAKALKTFQKTCSLIDGDDWAEVCAAARTATDARGFFEHHFRPVLIGAGRKALFTGYYEPELTASATRTARFRYPIYRKPPELKPGHRWYSRAEIETGGYLRGRGLEIAWLDDPVDAFFLQVQGSGRLHLTDGRVLRVGFAAKNGHPYRSVGTEMLRRGLAPRGRISARAIRAWVHRHPDRGRLLLRHNPSLIFFRVLKLPADSGPVGAMSRPVTAGRTIAVDPAFTPLGAPVWIEKTGHHPMRRLMVAQDAGSAIKGPQRADIFMGSGASAGKIAGAMKDHGRMVVLLPVPARALREARQ